MKVSIYIEYIEPSTDLTIFEKTVSSRCFPVILIRIPLYLCLTEPDSFISVRIRLENKYGCHNKDNKIKSC